MNEQNETKNTEEKEKKPVNWKSEIISWIQILVAAAAIAFVLNTFIIANSRVPSASMENTIMTGSRVIGSRLSYHFHEPERGDVVTSYLAMTVRPAAPPTRRLQKVSALYVAAPINATPRFTTSNESSVCQVTPSTSKTVTST